MTLEIDWREPPLSTEDRLKEVLKAHPGRWARIKKSMASPTASSPWRKAGFEAQSSPAESDPKKFDIYARWPESGDKPKLATAGPAAPAGAAAVAGSKPAVHTDINGVPVKGDAKPAPDRGYKYRGNDKDQVTAEELHRTGVRP